MRTRMDALIAKCQEVLTPGVRLSYPNASATAAQRAEARDSFLEQLDELNAMAARGGGPFLAGEAVTLADLTYAPMLERWAVQVRGDRSMRRVLANLVLSFLMH